MKVKCEITRAVAKDKSWIIKGLGSHTKMFRHEEPLKSSKLQHMIGTVF